MSDSINGGGDASTLPAGTGNAPGLGETFSIDLNTGHSAYTLPVALPRGVAGFTPQAGLHYSSAYGHGVFGHGWRLQQREIARRLDFGMPPEERSEEGTAAGFIERFMDSGDEIVPLADGSFGRLIESSSERHERQDDGWVVTERNGNRHELGLTAAARIVDPDRPEQVHAWLLETSTDPCGNEIRYSYLLDRGTAYLAEIVYAIYTVRISYEPRPDTRVNFRAGFRRETRLRGNKIELLATPPGGLQALARTWSITYTQSPLSDLSLLDSFTLTSHGDAGEVARNPIRFSYEAFSPEGLRVRRMVSTRHAAPPPLTEADVRLTTLDNAPLPGVLMVRDGAQFYWPNAGDCTWGEPTAIRQAPHGHSLADPGVVLADMDGDGATDLLVTTHAGNLHGYYAGGKGRGWSGFVAYPEGATTEPPWSSGRVALADLDGDGRTDALYSTGRGAVAFLNQGERGWSAPLVHDWNGGEIDLSDPLVRFADMTGDGLADLVRVRSGVVEYRPNHGIGRFGPPVFFEGAPDLPGATFAPDRVHLLDINGDGLADLVHVTASEVILYANLSASSFAPPVRIPIPSAPIPGTIRIADMNGAGRPGLVWNALRGREIVYIALCGDPQSAPYALAAIDHGTGLQSAIRYKSSVLDLLEDRKDGIQWDTALPFVPLVAAEQTDHDIVSGRESRTTFRYRDGHFEPSTRRFEGFGQVSRIEHGDESRADVRTVFHYRLREERQLGHGPQHAALNRMLFRTEVFSLDDSPRAGEPLKVETSTHTAQMLQTLPDGRLRALIQVASSREETSERTDDLHVSEHAFEYDEFSNVIQDTWRLSGRRDGVDLSARTLTTEVTYAKDPTDRILDRVARVVRRDQDGAIVAEVRRFYDGPAFTGLAVGQVTRGLVSRVEQLAFTEATFATLFTGMGDAGYVTGANADGIPSRYATTERFEYDARGVVTRQQDGMGRMAVSQHDPAGLFEQRRNEGAGDTVSLYDPRIGQPVRIDYPDGSSLRMTYDAQGRLLSLQLPGDEAPSRSYTYNDHSIPHAMHTALSLGGGATFRSVTYYDGYGLESQTRKARSAGQLVVSGLVRYNGSGMVKQEFEPELSASFDFERPDTAGKPSRTSFYDSLGRVVRTVNYNGGVSTAEYAPFLVTLADANDNDGSAENRARGQFNTPRTEELDLFRRRVWITEVTGVAPVVTTFAYTPVGALLSWSDATGQVARYTYDFTGRRTLIQHRDAGERRIWRDASMKVIRTVDGAGNDVLFDYDTAGRLKSVTRNGQLIEQYAYASPGIAGRSRVQTVRFERGSRSFLYSHRGDLLKKTLSIQDDPQGEISIQYEYDTGGREIQATFPGGEAVTREYYDDGLPRTVPGFIDNLAYDARGLPLSVSYANSVKTNYDYSPGVGRITTQKTVGPGNDVYEDLIYTFDLQERLLSETDTAGAGSTFMASYDPLYQLTQVEDSTLPTALEYTYQNGRYLTGNGESGLQLLYEDAARPGRINAVRNGAAPLLGVQYDGNGNMTALPGRNLTFNHRGELVGLTRPDGVSAQYRYDHQGDRISRSVTANGATKTTLFVDAALEIHDGEPAVCIVVGRSRVAIRRAGRTRFLHSDYLGTTRFVTDEAGNVSETASVLPFGTLRPALADASLIRYALHPFDEESGLVYMGRRYYAPEIASFITPDPIGLFLPEQAPGGPAGLHLYAYAANDPLNLYDPTGTSFWGIAGAIVGGAVGLGVGGILVNAFSGAVPLGVAVGATAAFVTVGYIVASSSKAGGGWEEFARGLLIGMNAGLNATLGSAVYGQAVGAVLGIINVAAVIEPVSQSKFYQGVLGWSNWLMPMSWFVNSLGVTFFALDDLFHGFTLKISMDWGTGTILLVNPGSKSFDLGNFAFVGAEDDATIAHETGHNLSLAAFGSAFHLIGAINEATSDMGQSVYAEQLADSHKSGNSHHFPLWGE